MPSLAEIRRALHGAWRLLLLDARALADFDGTRRGAWRSLWAAAIVLPLNVAALAIILIPGVSARLAAPQPNIPLVIAGLAVGWAALLVLVYGLVRWYGRSERYWLFVSTYNWTQIPLAVAAVLINLLDANTVTLTNPDAPTSTPAGPAFVAGIAFLVSRLLQVATLAYEWYVAWLSLEAGVLIPIIVVLLDYVLGMSIPKLAGLA